MSFPIERIKISVSPITNTIYIGRVNSSEDEWLDKRDCTDEALAVVRDHLSNLIEDGKNMFGYEWTRKDGKVVELLVKIRNSETEK